MLTFLLRDRWVRRALRLGIWRGWRRLVVCWRRYGRDVRRRTDIAFGVVVQRLQQFRSKTVVRPCEARPSDKIRNRGLRWLVETVARGLGGIAVQRRQRGLDVSHEVVDLVDLGAGGDSRRRANRRRQILLEPFCGPKRAARSRTKSIVRSWSATLGQRGLGSPPQGSSEDRFVRSATA